MSMLNNLKKTQKNHVFLDDDDDMDIDNMDFPLPTDDAQRPSSSSSSSAANPFAGLGGLGGGGSMPDMAQLQKMMQSMNSGSGGFGAEPQHPGAKDFVAVASGPTGDVRKMNPEDYKE